MQLHYWENSKIYQNLCTFSALPIGIPCNGARCQSWDFNSGLLPLSQSQLWFLCKSAMIENYPHGANCTFGNLEKVGFPFLLKCCSAVERTSYCVFLPGPFWELHNPKSMPEGVYGLRSSLSSPGKSPWSYVFFLDIQSSYDITLPEHSEKLLGQHQGRDGLLVAAASLVAPWRTSEHSAASLSPG